MAEPLSLAAILALQAAGKVSSGIPAAIGAGLEARAARLTPEEERELSLLQRAERRGEAALTAEQQAQIRQSFLAEQAGAAREQQATQLQAAAARAAAPATAGREIFLAEQAAQAAAMERTRARNLAEQAAEEQAQAERAARIAELQGQEEAARLARARAIATAVAVPFGAAGEIASTVGEAAMLGQLDPGLFTAPPEDEDRVAGYATGLGV